MDWTNTPRDRSRLKRSWHYTLEVLTPLHIGAGGDPLHQGTDFIATRSEVVVLDPERTFERIYEGAHRVGLPVEDSVADQSVGALADQLRRLGLAGEDTAGPAAPKPDVTAVVLARLAEGMTPNEALQAGWLTPADLQGEKSIVRYRLRPPSGVGAPLPNLEPPQILPMVKDARGRPYVPGSSLKGAIRTALAARIFAERKNPLVGSDVLARGRSNPKAADDNIESAMFGRDPNHDLLRTLLVGDTASIAPGSSPDTGGLALAVSGTYSIRQDRLQFKPGFYVALEVLLPKTQLSGTLRLDRYPFGADAQRQLQFGQTEDWLADFPRLANEHARALIAAEIPFYQKHGLSHVATFYHNLQRQLESLAPSECLLQISWGTGWLAKTFGPTLAAQAAFPEVREMFSFTMNRRPTAVYPKTRRLTLEGPGYSNPGVPLGWVRLRLAEDNT
jgi:CRISPR-associated protein Csm5